MRPRAKKNIISRLEKVSYLLVENPLDLKGQWSKNKPLHLEIGCGKGDFICQNAKNNPDINFIAVEMVRDIIIMALEKVDKEGLTNVRFMCQDARNLKEYFETGELDRIYLNFSDPWPKKARSKRRLTHPDFLNMYKELLKDGGMIYQKTDNFDLFEFSLESYTSMNCTLSNLTYDLHNSNYKGNVLTEYEKRFVEMGKPIYRVEAKFNR